MRYLPTNEIAVGTWEQACTVAQILLDNHCVVCISREEQLYIVNWEFSWLSDRNDIIFRSREDWEYEDMMEQRAADEEEEEWQREREKTMSSSQIEGQMSFFDPEREAQETIRRAIEGWSE